METVGNANKRYFYGLDLVAGTSGTAATTNYFTHDAHGSVALTTNSSGAAVQPYEYDAFGNLLNPASSDANPFRYSGEYFDSETGNYYLRVRYYDPGIGRFTQQDTHWNVSNLIYGDDKQTTVKGMEGFATIPQLLAIKQAGNRYGYCANDPINYIDSSGELAITLAFGYAFLNLVGAVVVVSLAAKILSDPHVSEAFYDVITSPYRDIKTGIDIQTAEDVEVNSSNRDEYNDDTIDIAPAPNHTSTDENSPWGTPNSSVDIEDSSGAVKTRRWYDHTGRAYRDVDFTNHGNAKEHPKVPHEHTWDWSSGKPVRK